EPIRHVHRQRTADHEHAVRVRRARAVRLLDRVDRRFTEVEAPDLRADDPAPAPQRDGNAAPRVARLRQVFDVRDVRAALVQERDPRRVPVQRGRVVGERRERLSQRRGARPHRKQQELRRTRAVADVVHLAGGRVLRRYPLRPGPREEQGCAGRERDPVSGAHCRPPAHGAWMIVNLPTFVFPSGVLTWKKYTPLATYCSFRFRRSQYATPPPDGSSWLVESTRTPESG